jgi:hypothetical protein
MDSLNATVAAIRAARNARNADRQDPVLNDADRAYRAGTLLSSREWPGWEAPPRKGRALPPSHNEWEYTMLHAIFGGGE